MSTKAKLASFSEMYTVEVTKEDIMPTLHRIFLDLMQRHGPSVERDLFGFALGPNSYKAYEQSLMVVQRLPFADSPDGLRFRQFEILASPYAGIVPLFRHRGWWIAHLQAKRWNTEGLH